MDILVSAARKSLTALCTCINTDIPTNTYNTYYTSAFNSANDVAKWAANGNTYVNYVCDRGIRTIPLNPSNSSSWISIPTMPNGNTSYAGCINGVGEYCGFKVCAPTGNLTSGACCQWTVPAGVKRARFQIWGAGAGSLSGCCCGGSISGTSGAYASVIIPVVPGCQYTLCAGCACAVPLLWTAAPTQAANSFVTGFGLCNFCAQGGKGLNHYCVLSYDMGASPYACCRYSSPDCATSSGGCICGSGDFCFASSCASCGCIPTTASRTTLYYGCYTEQLSNNDIEQAWASVVVGIPGLNGAHCFDTNFYGRYTHPPVYGFESVSCCCICHNTGASMGGICCNHWDYNYRRYPGAGGTAVALYSGVTAATAPLGAASALALSNGGFACGGDVGRSGMVCVTFC